MCFGVSTTCHGFSTTVQPFWPQIRTTVKWRLRVFGAALSTKLLCGLETILFSLQDLSGKLDFQLGCFSAEHGRILRIQTERFGCEHVTVTLFACAFSRMPSEGFSFYTLGVWGWRCVREAPSSTTVVAESCRAYGKSCKRRDFWMFQVLHSFVSPGTRGTL